MYQSSVLLYEIFLQIIAIFHIQMCQYPIVSWKYSNQENMLKIYNLKLRHSQQSTLGRISYVFTCTILWLEPGLAATSQHWETNTLHSTWPGKTTPKLKAEFLPNAYHFNIILNLKNKKNQCGSFICQRLFLSHFQL